MPSHEGVSAAIAEILNSPERLTLPIERIRQALKAHYLDNEGSIYWVGTGRMTPFIQRLEDAQFDGLNPDDYPVDTLIDLRDAIEPDDPHFSRQGRTLLLGLLRGLCRRSQDWPRSATES